MSPHSCTRSTVRVRTRTLAHTHTYSLSLSHTENAQVDAKDFKDDGANTLHADIDTRKCSFTGQPFYFAQVFVGLGFGGGGTTVAVFVGEVGVCQMRPCACENSSVCL